MAQTGPALSLRVHPGFRQRWWMLVSFLFFSFSAYHFCHIVKLKISSMESLSILLCAALMRHGHEFILFYQFYLFILEEGNLRGHYNVSAESQRDLSWLRWKAVKLFLGSAKQDILLSGESWYGWKKKNNSDFQLHLFFAHDQIYKRKLK